MCKVEKITTNASKEYLKSIEKDDQALAREEDEKIRQLKTEVIKSPSSCTMPRKRSKAVVRKQNK